MDRLRCWMVLTTLVSLTGCGTEEDADADLEATSGAVSDPLLYGVSALTLPGITCAVKDSHSYVLKSVEYLIVDDYCHNTPNHNHNDTNPSYLRLYRKSGSSYVLHETFTFPSGFRKAWAPHMINFVQGTDNFIYIYYSDISEAAGKTYANGAGIYESSPSWELYFWEGVLRNAKIAFIAYDVAQKKLWDFAYLPNGRYSTDTRANVTIPWVIQSKHRVYPKFGGQEVAGLIDPALWYKDSLTGTVYLAAAKHKDYVPNLPESGSRLVWTRMTDPRAGYAIQDLKGYWIEAPSTLFKVDEPVVNWLNDPRHRTTNNPYPYWGYETLSVVEAPMAPAVASANSYFYWSIGPSDIWAGPCVYPAAPSAKIPFSYSAVRRGKLKYNGSTPVIEEVNATWATTDAFQKNDAKVCNLLTHPDLNPATGKLRATTYAPSPLNKFQIVNVNY